jgi:hypothetical protein
VRIRGEYTRRRLLLNAASAEEDVKNEQNRQRDACHKERGPNESVRHDSVSLSMGHEPGSGRMAPPGGFQTGNCFLLAGGIRLRRHSERAGDVVDKLASGLGKSGAEAFHGHSAKHIE